MAFPNNTTVPDDHRRASSGKWRHIHFSDESVSLPLTAGAADHYEVRNYYGAVVATGSVSTGATTLNLGVLPLGWYKLYLIRPSTTGDAWRLAGGEGMFIVCRRNGALPNRPALGSSPGQDNAGEGIEFPTRGFIRMGPYRHTMVTDASYATSLSAALTDTAAEQGWWGTADTVRPLRQIGNFLDGTPPSLSPTASSRIASAVTQMVSAGCTWFEGGNEPMGTYTGDVFAGYEAAFAAVVRANGGLVAGPCPITLQGNPYSDSGDQMRRLQQFFAAGGGSSLDIVSFHNYNGGGGGLPLARRTMDGFVSLLTDYGQQGKPRFNTEFASYWAAVDGSYEPRQQTQHTMLDLMVLEQYGVPKEQTSLFYDRSHGFWGYPSWWVNSENDQMLNPLAATVRVWSEELLGKAFAARLDFGTVENDHFIGSRFAAPDGSAVVAMLSGGRSGNVTLQVTGGASSLVTVDPFGNTASATVTGGLLTVAVDTLPVYVRLPSSVTAVPVAAAYGVDVVTPRASLVSTTVSSTSSFPATYTVTFPAATRIDRVVVNCPPPANTRSALLDFDVQALVGGTWTTLQTFTETPGPTLQWTSTKDAGGCYVDSFYSRRHVWVVKLGAAVSATAVRVYARDATYGGNATSDIETAYSIVPGGGNGEGGPRTLDINSIDVYLSGTTDGGGVTAGQPFIILR